MNDRFSAANYAKHIGASVSTARRKLEAMVAAGTAKKIETYSEYCLKNMGSLSGWRTVRAVEYEIFSNG